MNPTEALDAIHDLMDGREWSADTLQDIALVLETAGYELHEPDEDHDDETMEREDYERAKRIRVIAVPLLVAELDILGCGALGQRFRIGLEHGHSFDR